MVCTGNICRSPLAEALLRREQPELRVASAGIGALVGQPADDKVAAIAEREGLDVSAHRAQQIDTEMVHEYELMLVMEARQRTWITRRFPQASGKVYLLGHWADKVEVPDPYKHSMDAFEQAYAAIERYLAQWLEQLG